MKKLTSAESFVYLESLSNWQRTVTFGRRCCIVSLVVIALIFLAGIIWAAANSGYDPEYLYRFILHRTIDGLIREVM